MSGVLSGMAIAVYLSASKSEQTQVASYIKSDPVLRKTVAGFQSDAATLGSSKSILANYKALQVLTGAYNMSGKINSRAILSDLMTQSADSATSLVRRSANTDYLHFARATQDRATQTAQLGSPAGLALSAAGASASAITLANTAWTASSATATAPGVRWSFVLNDGSAASSIASALNAASTASGGQGGYAVNAAGTISGPSDAPAITTSTDANGNTTYSIALKTDSAGKTVQRADIVSVRAAGTSTPAALLDTIGKALTTAGFDASLSPSGQFSVVAPATIGVNTLGDASSTTIATAMSDTVDTIGRLELGDAGKTLTAGQILLNGTKLLGAVQSVDAFGTVTLTAPLANTLAAGDAISVATPIGFDNIGTKATLASAVAKGGTILALGKAGIRLQAGQVIISGGTPVGTIKSVDAQGNATLLGGSAQTLAAGAALLALPASATTTTHALSDAKNVASIVSSYETNAYETKMGAQYPGMDNALYYARTMGGITSITQLMSNSRLLSVVTDSLGMGKYFGALDYAQQVRVLTSKVNLKTMTTPDGIKKTSLQYLINQAANTTTTPTGLAALYSGQSLSDTAMFGLASGNQPSTTTTRSASDPILSMFT